MTKQGLHSRLSNIVDFIFGEGFAYALIGLAILAATDLLAIFAYIIYLVERYGIWPHLQQFGTFWSWVALVIIHSPFIAAIIAGIILGDDFPEGEFGSGW